MINSSISTTIYPKGLKTSKVLPLLKKDKPPNNPESYRGINILPAIGKIQDKILSSQIQKFLADNDLIAPNHHGGRKFNLSPNFVTTKKLAKLGFDSHALQYMESYLSDRNQTVQIDGKKFKQLSHWSIQCDPRINFILFAISNLYIGLTNTLPQQQPFNTTGSKNSMKHS